ncbi:unnamed protein product [Gadus morhua 'NCC']
MTARGRCIQRPRDNGGCTVSWVRGQSGPPDRTTNALQTGPLYRAPVPGPWTNPGPYRTRQAGRTDPSPSWGPLLGGAVLVGAGPPAVIGTGLVNVSMATVLGFRACWCGGPGFTTMPPVSESLEGPACKRALSADSSFVFSGGEEEEEQMEVREYEWDWNLGESDVSQDACGTAEVGVRDQPGPERPLELWKVNAPYGGKTSVA